VKNSIHTHKLAAAGRSDFPTIANCEPFFEQRAEVQMEMPLED
jgi:hypothetical protein